MSLYRVREVLTQRFRVGSPIVGNTKIPDRLLTALVDLLYIVGEEGSDLIYFKVIGGKRLRVGRYIGEYLSLLPMELGPILAIERR